MISSKQRRTQSKTCKKSNLPLDKHKDLCYNERKIAYLEPLSQQGVYLLPVGSFCLFGESVFVLTKERDMEMSKQLLTESDVKAAEAILSKGDRVELIPVKDGVRVIRIKREEIKNESKM